MILARMTVLALEDKICSMQNNNSYIDGRSLTTVTMSPHWFQWIIDNLMGILVCCLAFWMFAFATFPYHKCCCVVWLVVSIYLLYRMIWFARIEYVITTEQLILLQGVVSHSTDYVELYRVVDYQQNQSVLQQIAGLKTVVIYSGDHNNPKVELTGMRAKEDVVAFIRQRVEYNKKRKGIYEITNRF